MIVRVRTRVDQQARPGDCAHLLGITGLDLKMMPHFYVPPCLVPSLVLSLLTIHILTQLPATGLLRLWRMGRA